MQSTNKHRIGGDLIGALTHLNNPLLSVMTVAMTGERRDQGRGAGRVDTNASAATGRLSAEYLCSLSTSFFLQSYIGF